MKSGDVWLSDKGEDAESDQRVGENAFAAMCM